MFLLKMSTEKTSKQAGAELCQAQVVVVVEFGVDVKACHYQSGGQWWVGGQWDKKDFGPRKLRPPKNWVPKVWSKLGQ